MLNLDGKVAFVSGIGSVGSGWGNGRAVSVLMARQGAKVFGTDRDLKSAQDTREIIIAEGGTCNVMSCNMTDSAQVSLAVNQCLNIFGSIDILVNNVGGSAPGSAASMSEQVWDLQIEQNLKTVFLCCHAILPLMEQQGSGVIINVGSIAALRMSPSRTQIAYSTAKLGLLAFTRSTAISYARKNIRCNIVVPGLMDTPLVAERLVQDLNADNVETLAAARNEMVPMGRMGNAWDVAHAVLFLVSDEANYITGAEIVVDGGLTAA